MVPGYSVLIYKFIFQVFENKSLHCQWIVLVILAIKAGGHVGYLSRSYTKISLKTVLFVCRTKKNI
jgi:hypothetical protein